MYCILYILPCRITVIILLSYIFIKGQHTCWTSFKTGPHLNVSCFLHKDMPNWTIKLPVLWCSIYLRNNLNCVTEGKLRNALVITAYAANAVLEFGGCQSIFQCCVLVFQLCVLKALYIIFFIITHPSIVLPVLCPPSHSYTFTDTESSRQ